MPSNPPTPEGDPGHTSYEFAVPVRNGPSLEPQSPRSSPSSQSSESSPSSPAASQPETQPGIHIPRITPLSVGPSPAELADGLDGKLVDEFGNVLDWDGTVLGRVEGDLPSMVGRPVTASGEVFDNDLEVAGHVSENYSRPSLKPLGGGLKVDDEGNIYDEQGGIVGKLNNVPTKNSDNNNSSQTKNQNNENNGGNNQNTARARGGYTQRNGPRAASPPRPDEVYLDVKSTWDGIQLIIKIPTVFTRESRERNSQ
ncbi:hypothetical protein G7046_g3076 [Stylonectria norvegica]|nr:hypothetical protein G7046_g3076 [Stylonectria norvegica]